MTKARAGLCAGVSAMAMMAAALAVTATLPAGGALAAEPAKAQSPWMIRGRALAVVPQESGKIDQVPGSDVRIDNSVVPELDITYFFTPNIAAELILGVTPHNIKGSGSLAGIDVGKAWLLPPTLTLQYHFTDFGRFKPYVGAGINYTVFFNEKAAGGVVNKLDIEDSFGAALQVGVDYMIDDHWGVNFDVKKLFLRPDVKLNGGALTGKVDIDPWLIGVGVTYRF
ncbi:OmpW family protein [Stella sp.]|uniref:OmpW/AlkL family protein n=1 Tax=Stella sp. TaxID=2912054 RepID=UPI0035B49373